MDLDTVGRTLLILPCLDSCFPVRDSYGLFFPESNLGPLQRPGKAVGWNLEPFRRSERPGSLLYEVRTTSTIIKTKDNFDVSRMDYVERSVRRFVTRVRFWTTVVG